MNFVFIFESRFTKMNSFLFLWAYVIILPKTVTSHEDLTPGIKRIISRIGNQVNTLRSDVDFLTFDSAETRKMIVQLNETRYLQNKYTHVNREQNGTCTDIKVMETQTLNAEVDEHATQLLKAFQDEKLFSREKMDKLTNYQKDNTLKIEKLEGKYIDIRAKQRKDIENVEAYMAKNEIDLDIFKTRMHATNERIEEMESDYVSLNENVIKGHKKNVMDIAEIKKQQKVLITKLMDLETSYTFLQDKLQNDLLVAKMANKCDSSWKYNNNLNSCFLFMSRKRKWDEAVKFCKAKGARLVEISSEQTHEQVKRMYEEGSFDWGGGKYDGFWAGGSMDGWTWIWEGSNSRFEWTNWYPGEPGRIQRHLAVMVNDIYFRWDDQEDWNNKPFICEKRVT